MDAITATVPDAGEPEMGDTDVPVAGPKPHGDRSALMIALLAITIPLAMTVPVWSTPTGALDWSRRVQIAPFDLALLAIVGWAVLHISDVVEVYRSPAVRVVSGLFIVWFGVSLAANPSWLGVELALRLGAGVCVIACMAVAMRSAAGRTLVLGSITVAGVAQALIGVVQAQRGSVTGITLLDWNVDLYQFGSSSAAQGGLPHPYHLTSFLLMAQAAALLGLRHTRASRLPWLLALGTIAVGVAITYSRAAAVGEVALIGCAVVARADRRLLAKVAAAVLAGFLIGAVGFGSGWIERSETTSGQRQGATIDGDRRTRLAEAGELLTDNPVFGVGPGQYVEALYGKEREVYQPAHNLIAHEAAEFGVVGSLLMITFVGLLGLRVLRGGAWTGAVVLPMVPMLALGSTGYVLATSLAVSALWLGLARASLEPMVDAPP